jgi:FkbM family methyltransferase
VSLSTALFDAMPPALRHRFIAAQYRLSEGELRRIADFVPRDKAAIDIGAWWGPWTYWLSRRAISVDTFEPVPYIAEFLKQVSRPNVTVHNVALSDRAESAVLHVPSSGTGSEGRSTLHEPPFADATDIAVQVVPLDSVALPKRIGFIKVDVEGHEMQVLRGAAETIAEHRPVLLVEVESHDDRQTRVEDVVDLLTSHGYEASFLRKGTWVPITEFDLERDQRALAETVRRRGLIGNMLLTRGYVNNFLFRPKG